MYSTKHKHPERVGNNIVGTRYIFTLPLKDGGEKKATLEPGGSATHWWCWVGFWRKRVHEMGSEGCWSTFDSDPNGFMKKLNKGEFVLCDDGTGVNGHQVKLDKITVISEDCTVPMKIERAEMVDTGPF